MATHKSAVDRVMSRMNIMAFVTTKPEVFSHGKNSDICQVTFSLSRQPLVSGRGGDSNQIKYNTIHIHVLASLDS